MDKEKKFLIKRIIGLPGERVKIQNGEVHIQQVGESAYIKIQEGYLSEKNSNNTCVKGCTSSEKEKEYVTGIIPGGSYYLL